MLDTSIKFAKAFDKMIKYANYLKYFEEKEKKALKDRGENNNRITELIIE